MKSSYCFISPSGIFMVCFKRHVNYQQYILSIINHYYWLISINRNFLLQWRLINNTRRKLISRDYCIFKKLIKANVMTYVAQFEMIQYVTVAHTISFNVDKKKKVGPRKQSPSNRKKKWRYESCDQVVALYTNKMMLWTIWDNDVWEMVWANILPLRAQNHKIRH